MNAPAKIIPRLSPSLEARFGIAFISRRLLLQGIASLAGAFLSCWDLYKAIGTRNTGQIVGYGVVVAGSLALLASTALSGAATGATILGLTVGWWLAVGFALFALGYFIIEAFTYTPFEEWIIYGPFAEANTNGIFGRDQYPIEQASNQEEAFYRLVSLIANIRADFKEVSDQEWGLLNTPYTKPTRTMKMSFNSTLPGLLSNPSAYYTIAEVQIGFSYARPDQCMPITSYFQQSTPDGVNLYFDMQADAAKIMQLLRDQRKNYYVRNGLRLEELDDRDIVVGSAILSYVARIQIRVYDKQRKLSVYPAPLPLEKVTFDETKNGQVPSVYDDSYHTFWVRGESQYEQVFGKDFDVS